MVEQYRILEFFCGIGCMHHALRYADIVNDYDTSKENFIQDVNVESKKDNVKVVESFDINPICGDIYAHNFNNKQPSRTTINILTEEKLLKYNANVWIMSPPCQPYTRTGSQKQSNDIRSNPLHHLCTLIPKLKPKKIFLENVVGFESSDSRDELISILLNQSNDADYKYTFVEFIITPTELGIPNERPRYYLLAWNLDSNDIPFDLINEIKSSKDYTSILNYSTEDCVINKDLLPSITTKITPFLSYLSKKEVGNAEPIFKNLTVNDFLDSTVNSANNKDIILSKMPNCLKNRNKMVTSKNSITTNCFTKAYGHHAWGSGSFLHIEDECANEYNEDVIDIDPKSNKRVRIFTPSEISRLLGLPIYGSPINNKGDFNFPDTITDSQRWKSLGNSMSVIVVAELLRILFSKP